MNGPHRNEFEQKKESYAFIPGLGLISEDPREKERAELRIVSNKIGMALILYILLSLFLSVPLIGLLSLLGFPVRIDWISGVYYAPAAVQQVVNLIMMLLRMGLPCLFLWKTMRPELSAQKVMRSPRAGLTMAAVFIGLAASVSMTYVVEMLQQVFVSAGFLLTSQTLNIPTEPLAIVLYFVLMVVLPAFLEELLFRGAIMHGLKRFGDGLAVLLSALLFALAHLSLISGGNAFVMGLIIGYFVIKTGSLWTGILMHFFINTVGFLQAMFSVGALRDYASDIVLIINVILLALGLLVFVVVTLRDKSLFYISYPSSTCLSTRERLVVFFSSVLLLAAVVTLIFLSLSVLQVGGGV